MTITIKVFNDLFIVILHCCQANRRYGFSIKIVESSKHGPAKHIWKMVSLFKILDLGAALYAGIRKIDNLCITLLLLSKQSL